MIALPSLLLLLFFFFFSSFFSFFMTLFQGFEYIRFQRCGVRFVATSSFYQILLTFTITALGLAVLHVTKDERRYSFYPFLVREDLKQRQLHTSYKKTIYNYEAKRTMDRGGA
ncbi:uncharacterized protein LOC110263711 [Arachis ipaensis]|uniref:uncharacterized protein LOC110263711 n=1 Tax=Arachis ipaensis TaxID=130454 RepID=UPI000A2B7C13|nr:uncharacterized protein LOC110263711 [Arachis ipaensis]